MKILVKLGGTLLDDPASRTKLATELAALSHECELAVVHGGGKQVTQFLAARGLTSRFVNGLRVSDEIVIDAVSKVIAGSVNKQLVSALIAAGRPAVGISGVDGSLTVVQQLDAALGWVGRPVLTNTRLLTALLSAGWTPVVACIAADEQGQIFNVNADAMAVACAAAWHADKLFFLTDVDGVKNALGVVLPTLSSAQAGALITDGVAKGGMQAKLEASQSALSDGVSEVVIASGHAAGICARLWNSEPVGTRIHP